LFAVFLPAVALGCADGMIAEFTKRQRVRKNAYTNAQGILNPAGYMRLAESTHELESLTVYYRHLLDSMQRHGEVAERLTEAKSLEMQSTLPFISARVLRVIDRLFEAAGASAMADFNPMQRYWRDGHTVRLHLGSDYDISLRHHPGESLVCYRTKPRWRSRLSKSSLPLSSWQLHNDTQSPRVSIEQRHLAAVFAHDRSARPVRNQDST
jgi:Acyl-CoA dehydrogenase, C-terminal domain